MFRVLLAALMLALNAYAMDDEHLFDFDGQFAELVNIVKTHRLSKRPLSHWLHSANDLVLKTKSLADAEFLAQIHKPLSVPLRINLGNGGPSLLGPLPLLVKEETASAYVQSLTILKECMNHPERLQHAIEELCEEEDRSIRVYILEEQKLLQEAKGLAL